MDIKNSELPTQEKTARQRGAGVKSVLLAACLVLTIPSFASAAGRGGGGGSGNGVGVLSSGGGDIVAQLDEARRLVDQLKAQATALHGEVAQDVGQIRRSKRDPSTANVAYDRLFAAVSSAQSTMESELQRIIQIGQGLLSR